jgi:hypothetical protein
MDHKELAVSICGRLYHRIPAVDRESYLAYGSVWTLYLQAVQGHVHVSFDLKKMVEV